MKIALQVEGQRGLTWDRWQRFTGAVEALGFYGIYRSDHFLDEQDPNQDSLSLWPSLTWLASHSKRLHFGPLVTPLSFQHPVHTARSARDVDDLSGGRLTLGLGAGWEGARLEHTTFGFDLLDLNQRFARFEEGLAVIRGLLKDDPPFSLDGHYYQLRQAALLPRPSRAGGPPLLVGGNGPKRVLPLAARYADEWNSIYRTPAQFAVLNAQFDELLEQFQRPRTAVLRSQMNGLVFGSDEADLQRKLAGRLLSDLWEGGVIVGTSAQIVDQLGQLESVGVSKVMLQWNDLDDLDTLEIFANSILHQIQTHEEMQQI